MERCTGLQILSRQVCHVHQGRQQAIPRAAYKGCTDSGWPFACRFSAAHRIEGLPRGGARRRLRIQSPAEQAQRYGAELSVLEWRDRLVCSRCGTRQIDMVVTGERWLIPRPGQRGADPNAAVISTRSLLAPTRGIHRSYSRQRRSD
jgi:hypothetical protein